MKHSFGRWRGSPFFIHNCNCIIVLNLFCTKIYVYKILWCDIMRYILLNEKSCLKIEKAKKFSKLYIVIMLHFIHHAHAYTTHYDICMRVREMEKGKRLLLAVHSGRCLLTGLSWRFYLLPFRASAVALLIVTTWTAGTPPCCHMLTQRLR